MKVEYTDEAQFELAEIDDYISHNLSNSQAAENLLQKIKAEVDYESESKVRVHHVFYAPSNYFAALWQ